MKHIIKIAIFILLFQYNSHAQSHYSGQYSIGVNGGISAEGYYGNINLQKLVGNKFFLGRVDLNYINQDIDLSVYETTKVPYQIATLGLGAGYSFENFIPHPLYFQLYAGGFLGNETLNENDDTYPNSQIHFENPSGFIYGVYVGAELELAIFKNLSLTANFSQNYKPGSEIGKSFFQAGGGIKFNL